MIPKISSFELTDNFRMIVSFDDGKKVIYNVLEDINQLPDFIDLKNIYGLWDNARLDLSRTCITWNEMIDLPSDSIYEYGSEIL